MTQRQKIQLKFLQENLDYLREAEGHLEWSWQKCQKINLDGVLTNEALEALEALAARFARTVDIYTQKIVPGLLGILEERHPTFLDRANLLEKIGVVSSAGELVEIRGIRNAIAHEYRKNDYQELYKEMFKSIDPLRDIIRKTREYISAKIQ